MSVSKINTNRLKFRNRLTPDMGRLNILGLIPVFVYSTDKSTDTQSYILDGAEFYGPAYTFSKDLIMKNPHNNLELSYLNRHPVVFEHEGVDSNRVIGELYGALPIQIHSLDRLLGRGVRTERKMMGVFAPDKEGIIQYVKAFMYLGNESFYSKFRMSEVRRQTFKFGEGKLASDVSGYYY